MKLICQGFDGFTFQVPNVRTANVETLTLNSDEEYEKGLLLTPDRTVHGLFTHLGEIAESSQLTKKQSRRLAQRRVKGPYYGYFNSDKSIYCVSTELFFEIQLHGLFFLKYSPLEMLLKIFEYLKSQSLSFYLSRSDYQLTVRGSREKFFSMIWQDCLYSEHFELIPRIKAGSVKRFEAEYSRMSVVGYDKKSHLDSISESPYYELFKQKHTGDFEDLFRVEFRLHYADKNQKLSQKIKEGLNLTSLKFVFLELIGEQVKLSKQLKKFIAGGRYER